MDEISSRGGPVKQAEQYLRQLFNPAIQRAFDPFIELRRNERVRGYVTEILVDFHASDHLWSIRDSEGKPIVRVDELLMKADPVFGAAASFEEERTVRKHIGDYAMFVAGIFPEGSRKPRLHWMDGAQGTEAVMKVGKESYAVVASFDQFEYRDEAPLFLDLARNFELCVEGLHHVARELLGNA